MLWSSSLVAVVVVVVLDASGQTSVIAIIIIMIIGTTSGCVALRRVASCLVCECAQLSGEPMWRPHLPRREREETCVTKCDC